MKSGKIKWFNPEKGYGFIRPDEGGEDVLLHMSVVEEAGLDVLEPGQDVRFALEEGIKKDNKKSASVIEVPEV